MAHEITGVKVAQKTWHKLLEERQHGTQSSHIASTKEIVEDATARTANSKVQESIKGLNDKHSKFEIEQENVTDTPQCMISTIDHGEQVDHRKTGKGKSKHTGKGKGKHVDVVATEQPQPSEKASTVSAIGGGDADETMDMVRLEAETWRLIHSRYAQNTLTAEMISGSLFHDHADEHNQLPDVFVISTESKEQSQTEHLAGMQAHHHEQQIFLPRPLDEYQTKFRDEHNEITKTMKDLSIIHHQAELEEKAGNEQHLRKKLSMVVQDNDAKHGDVNSRQEAYQEDDNLKLRNESVQEYKELHEQIQAYFSSTPETMDQKFKQELNRMAKDAHRETQRYVANLQSIFGFPEEKVQISQDHDMLDGSDWDFCTAKTLHVTDDQFERFHAKVNYVA